MEGRQTRIVRGLKAPPALSALLKKAPVSYRTPKAEAANPLVSLMASLSWETVKCGIRQLEYIICKRNYRITLI
jgi:hypothetical protein